MKAKVRVFARNEISFVDMGTCLTNQEAKPHKKYYFVKMIHFNQQKQRRDIYILAFGQASVTKWDNSLGLNKEPTFVDAPVELMR